MGVYSEHCCSANRAVEVVYDSEPNVNVSTMPPPPPAHTHTHTHTHTHCSLWVVPYAGRNPPILVAGAL